MFWSRSARELLQVYSHSVMVCQQAQPITPGVLAIHYLITVGPYCKDLVKACGLCTFYVNYVNFM